MKLLALGVILVVYAIFCTPCFIEPTDIVVSSAYIVMANEMGVHPWIIWLWIMSGYVALMFGVILGIGGTYIHFRHPLMVLGAIAVSAGILSYWLLFVSGLVITN